MNIFDYFTAEEIGVYVSETMENSIPYLGEQLFPNEKQLGLELSWIKGANGLPVQLKNSAFDAKATLRDRKGFSKVETEMPFFRESMRIGEKDRQELNKVLAANNSNYVMPIINNIYDDIGGLTQSARVSAEIMRMQLLSTGQISVVNNGVKYTYDYGHPAELENTLTSTAKWTDYANATPLQDMKDSMDAVEEETGERPVNALMTRTTFNYLLQCEQIKALVKPALDASKVMLTEPQVKQAIQDYLGLNIVVYTKKFKNLEGVSELYYPDDTVTFFPSGNLGNTYYGTTPEESDLMSGNTDANVQIVNTGIAITTIKEAHPVNVKTVVSGIFLPSFETIDQIFILNVNG